MFLTETMQPKTLLSCGKVIYHKLNNMYDEVCNGTSFTKFDVTMTNYVSYIYRMSISCLQVQ